MLIIWMAGLPIVRVFDCDARVACGNTLGFHFADFVMFTTIKINKSVQTKPSLLTAVFTPGTLKLPLLAITGWSVFVFSEWMKVARWLNGEGGDSGVRELSGECGWNGERFSFMLIPSGHVIL